MSFWQRLSQPIIGLAPMDGVTDSVFREMIAIHGNPDVTFTEFTNVRDIYSGRECTLDSLRFSERERPVIAQLYGKDPDLFYHAAQVVCELGFDGLDINMGCPSKNVATSGSGAGLIRTPDVALHIMKSAHQGLRDWAEGQPLSEGRAPSSLIKKISSMNHSRLGRSQESARRLIPLSVKTRIGYDSDIIDEWSECLIQGKPEVISIHGRTLKQMYRGQSNWESIARAAVRLQEKGIFVLGNGDVGTLNEAVQRLLTTSVNGVLIGRAALGNPWIFQGIPAIRQRMTSRERTHIPEPVIATEERFHIMIQHARMFETVNGRGKFPRMRKHLGWYCSGFPHAAAMRAQMVHTSCTQDVEDIVNAYLTSPQTTPQDSPSLFAVR